MAMEDATRIKYATDGLVLRSVPAGSEHPLQGEMLVGREVECAITLNSTQASRYHAKINVSTHGVYLEDLHSTNGTYINGKKTRGRIRLSIGDEITFDTVAFRLVSTNSGAADVTALTPKRINSTQPIKRQASVPLADQAKTDPVEPTPLKSEPVQPLPLKPQPPIDESLESGPSLEEAEAFSQPINREKPVASVASAAWQPESITFDSDGFNDGSNTQMISSTHMNHLVERNKNDINISIGSGPRLIVMTAPLRGKVFNLEADNGNNRWLLGRSSDSNIQINDKTISMDHARLTSSSKGYVLTSTHAKNAVLINGQKQKQTVLEHNDKIQIGRTELLFRTDDSPLDEHDVEAMPYEELRNHKFTLISTLAIITVIIIAIVTTAK